MAQYETTGGDVIIAIDQCDCGSTGGCDKCRPFILPKQVNCEDFIPLFNEQWKQQRLREIREDSHKRYGGAWQKLADI